MSLQTAAVGRTAAIQESGLLDQIIAESRVAQSDHEKNRARDIIVNWLTRFSRARLSFPRTWQPRWMPGWLNWTA